MFPMNYTRNGVTLKLVLAAAIFTLLIQELLKVGYKATTSTTICASELDLAKGTKADDVLLKAFNTTTSSLLSNQVQALIKQIELGCAQSQLICYQHNGDDIIDANGEVRAEKGQIFVLAARKTNIATNINFIPVVLNEDTRTNEEQAADNAESTAKSFAVLEDTPF